MIATQEIRPDLTVNARPLGGVLGSRGAQVGTVDQVEGDFIKLKREDSPNGQHHFVPIYWVERVDNRTVYLSRTLNEVEKICFADIPKNREL